MHALIFFLDGVGLGERDPVANPFATADMPTLTSLFGADWWWRGRGPITSANASLVPTDANLGVRGRPQSATGQATILTGKNIPKLIGEHYGPKPNEAVREVLAQGTLFSEVTAAGGTAALLTPYPDRYFEGINSGKRLLSAVPLAATSGGIKLFGPDEIRQGAAVSPEFTGEGWRSHLGYDDIPIYTPHAAGQRIAQLAAAYTFSFFEHWPSDRAGHRGTLAKAREHLELIDMVVGGLLERWDAAEGLLIITSDHGNIEDKTQRQHTRNPVPTILVGRGHEGYARMIVDLSDIAAVVRQHLQLG